MTSKPYPDSDLNDDEAVNDSPLRWIGTRMQSTTSSALGIVRSYLEADYEKSVAVVRRIEIPGNDRAEARDLLAVLVRCIDEELKSRDRRAGVIR